MINNFFQKQLLKYSRHKKLQFHLKIHRGKSMLLLGKSVSDSKAATLPSLCPLWMMASSWLHSYGTAQLSFNSLHLVLPPETKDHE